jgi:ankyrin repeat protein
MVKVSQVLVIVGLLTITSTCRARNESIGSAELYWLMNRACAAGDEISVRMLLKAGADANGVRDFGAFHQSSYQRGYEPSWPINLAARGGHADIVRLLLRAGAKADNPEGEGNTALTFAADRGQLEVVRALLDGGADWSYRGAGQSGSGTAEEIARRNGHDSVADVIRSYRRK